jgi:membrane protease YdiL (CAAX protease family)
MARFSHLAGFYGLACLLTWSCWLPILAEKRGLLSLYGRTELLATLGQFGPFIAAVFWIWIEQGGSGIRDLCRRMLRANVSPACLVVALLLPPVLFSAAIGINVWLGNQTAPTLQFPEPVGTTLHFLINLAIGGSLGEEPGWRGYALPRLRKRFGVLLGSIILALAWACWHLPLWWIAEVPSSFPIYVLGMIPLTILFTWLDEWSKGSVLVALLFHASLNTSLIRLPVFPAIVIVNLLFWLVALPIVVSHGRAWLFRSPDANA